MKRCCIIYNQPSIGALADELDVLDQVDHIEKHMELLGIKVDRKGISDKFMDEIPLLAVEKYDFVFNLVESINNKGELNYFIPALLNLYSIPYSGNPLEAMFLTSNKTMASKAMKRAGINNPVSYKVSQWNQLKPGQKYIVKPIWEDGSLGITADSVFICEPGFEKKLEGMDDAHWFIEEFIEGREFNMSVLAGKNGPEVMPVAEIVFVGYDESRPRIIDFKAKWEMDSFEYENTVREFPVLDAGFESRLKETALACWNLFGLKGYARVDARADANNNIFVIEANANPCISPDGGYVAATKKGGYEFTEVLQRIIDDLNY
ncbi:MAG TPA: ATP-grasp domain-containing protein [Bacteroidales bacterium]|nr:ATP-grasp domain-containing protein [Bacteroidales bacterium]